MNKNSKQFKRMKEEFLNLCLETSEDMEIFNEALAARGCHWEDGYLIEGSHRSSNTLSSQEKTIAPRWNKVNTSPSIVGSTVTPPRARAPPLVKTMPSKKSVQSRTKIRKVKATSSASSPSLSPRLSSTPSSTLSSASVLQISTSPSPTSPVPTSPESSVQDDQISIDEVETFLRQHGLLD